MVCKWREVMPAFWVGHVVDTPTLRFTMSNEIRRFYRPPWRLYWIAGKLLVLRLLSDGQNCFLRAELRVLTSFNRRLNQSNVPQTPLREEVESEYLCQRDGGIPMAESDKTRQDFDAIDTDGDGYITASPGCSSGTRD